MRCGVPKMSEPNSQNNIPPQDNASQMTINLGVVKIEVRSNAHILWAMLGVLTTIIVVISGVGYVALKRSDDIAVLFQPKPVDQETIKVLHQAMKAAQAAAERATEELEAQKRAAKAAEELAEARAKQQRELDAMERERARRMQAQREADDEAARARLEKAAAARKEALEREAAARAQEEEAAKKLAVIQQAAARAEATVREAAIRATAEREAALLARQVAADAAKEANEQRLQAARLREQATEKRYRVRLPDKEKKESFTYVPLRRQAGLDSTSIANLSPGTAIVATGREKDTKENAGWFSKGDRVTWIEVNYQGKTGWVAKLFVEQERNQAQQ